MGVTSVTGTLLATSLLVLLTYSIGAAGRWIRAPKMTLLGAAIIGAGAGVFLIAPTLPDFAKIAAGLHKNGYLIVEVSTAPADLPKVVKTVERYRGTVTSRYVKLEVSVNEPVPSDRRKWITIKAPKAVPDIKRVEFATPTKMIVQVDLKSTPISKLPQIVDNLSKWITYTSGFVVVGATASIQVKVPLTEYDDFKREVMNVADLEVLYNPAKAIQERIQRMLPSPSTAVLESILGFVGVAALGWFGIGRISDSLALLIKKGLRRSRHIGIRRR